MANALPYQQRIEIFSLWRSAGWSKRKVAQALQIAPSTVRNCIASGVLTPPEQVGRRPLLTTRERQRLRLVARATFDAFHRRLCYEEIARIDNIQVCKRSRISAFEKEQYHCRIAAERPFLTEKHKKGRL